MPTIKDVARVAGVSTSTVSSFLNQTKYVSPDLARQIRAAMDALNYRRAHPIASSLRRKQTGHVGVIFNQLADEQAMRTLKAISDALNDHGFTLMLRNSKADAATEAQHVRDLLSRQADGLILVPVGLESIEILDELGADSPLVLLGNALNEWLMNRSHGDGVAYALEEGSRLAITHLLDHGHHRIGLIGNTDSQQAFVRGYTEAMNAAGYSVDRELIRLASPSHQGGQACLQALMERSPRPSALFVSEPAMLSGVLNSLFSLGIRCPTDMSLIAFGHFDWADAVQPPLTTLQGNGEQMGRLAVLRLIEQLGPYGQSSQPDRGQSERVEYIPTRLIERGSVTYCREAVTPHSTA